MTAVYVPSTQSMIPHADDCCGNRVHTWLTNPPVLHRIEEKSSVMSNVCRKEAWHTMLAVKIRKRSLEVGE